MKTCTINITDSAISLVIPSGSSLTLPAPGDWGAGTPENPIVQRNINSSLIAVEKWLGRIPTETSLHITPERAAALANSAEYHAYINGGLGVCALSATHNPNREHRLAEYLYGLRLVVEPKERAV